MTEPNLTLEYDVMRLTLVEKALGRSMSNIVAEITGEEGASLTTLQALVAAGTYRPNKAMVVFGAFDFNMTKGAALIEQHGVTACAKAAGDALKALFERIA